MSSQNFRGFRRTTPDIRSDGFLAHFFGLRRERGLRLRSFWLIDIEAASVALPLEHIRNE